MRRIGILGGSFDPIHNGHLYLAEQSQKQLGLDEVIFLPTYKAKHKDYGPYATFEERCQMIELMIAEKDNFRLDVQEKKLQMNSYTLYSLKAFREKYGSRTELNFIIGGDSYLNFHLWHRWAEILDLSNILVIHRPGYDDEFNEIVERDALNKKFDIIHIEAEAPMISSSEIRRLLKEDEDISAYVNEAVERYIHENRLYQ